MSQECQKQTSGSLVFLLISDATVESPQYSLNPGCGIVALLVYPSHALRAYTPFSTLDKRLTESVVRRGRTH